MTLSDYCMTKRHVLLTEARLGDNNPYHARHIEQFCDYADSVGEKIKKEIMAELPKLIAQYMKQPKVQVEVDEASLKRVKEKVQGLLDSIFGRR